jgi:hypothetical protein
MRISELFVLLGFKVEGADAIPAIEKQMGQAAATAGKLAAGIDVVTAGLLYMVDTALNAAVGLSKFSLSTGLSTTELQQWQHTAAVANVSAADLQKTVMGLQEVGSRIMLGGGAAAQPWLLLGLNPNMDPFEMLKQLHAALQNITPERLAAARVIAEQAGISNDMFQMLRQRNLPIDALKQQYLLLGQNQEKLMRLNRDWNTLKDNATRVKNVFSSEMAPALTKLVDLLLRGVDKLAQFVHWLNGGSPAADLMRHALMILGLGIGVLGGALTIFAVVAKTTSLALGGLQLAFSPLILEVGVFTAAMVAAVAQVYAMYVGVQALGALMKQYETGKAADAAERRLAAARKKAGVKPVTERDKRIAKDYDEEQVEERKGTSLVRALFDPRPQKGTGILQNAPGWVKSLASGDLLGAFQSPAVSPIGRGVTDTYFARSPAEIVGHETPSTTTHNRTSNIRIDKIQVDGARDPQAVVKAIGANLSSALNAAGANAPAKSY